MAIQSLPQTTSVSAADQVALSSASQGADRRATVTALANAVALILGDTPDSGVAVVNDLTTGGTTVALSAEQGKVLQGSKAGLSGATFTGPVLLAADPSTALQAATKQYVDANAGGTAVTVVNNLTTGGTTAALSAEQGKTLQGSKADATATTAALALKAALAGATFTGAVLLAGDPASALQAATKQYVDSIATNVGRRDTARVATTANITIATGLNAGDVIDTVTLASGDKVLVKNQTSAAENGVYDVSATPARNVFFDTFAEYPGSLIAVQEGTQADTLWLCTSNVGGTLGTTALTFSQGSGPVGALLAANNLSDLAAPGSARTNIGLGNVDNTSDVNKPVSTAQATVIGLKADAASPVFSGPITGDGISVTTPNALGAGTAINVAKGLNTKSISGNTTLTFSGTPSAAGGWFQLLIDNTAGSLVVLTIPSSKSAVQGAITTTVNIPASSFALLTWLYANGAYYLLGG